MDMSSSFNQMRNDFDQMKNHREAAMADGSFDAHFEATKARMAQEAADAHMVFENQKKRINRYAKVAAVVGTTLSVATTVALVVIAASLIKK